MNRRRTLERNTDIKDDFKKLCSIREHGVQKHSFEWILAELAKKYYLSATTIGKILKQN